MRLEKLKQTKTHSFSHTFPLQSVVAGAALGSDYNATRGHVAFGLGVVGMSKEFSLMDNDGIRWFG